MSGANGGQGYRGFQEPETASSDFNAQDFIIKSILSRIQTATLVEVMAVTNSGGLSPVGFVDIMPLVNQVDGAGNSTPHGTIHNCAYLRMQGGVSAVILDPVVGDIGLAVFASRNIASVQATKGQSNPGSSRRHSMADGLYVGGMLNGTPSQYIQFLGAGGGINLVSATEITTQAPTINLIGNVVQSGGTMTSNGHSIDNTHKHTGVATGGGTSGAPV